MQLDFSQASWIFEASEQLSVQAVGSRCRDASPSSQLRHGEVSVLNAAFVFLFYVHF